MPTPTRTPLRFDHLREQNLPRCRRWHPDGAPPWTHEDWLLALNGEVGEALNIVKKLNRDRDGLAGNTSTRAELVAQLGLELADVVIYLDIILGWNDRPPLGDDGHADFASFGGSLISREAPPSFLGNELAAIASGCRNRGLIAWGGLVLCATCDLANAFDIDLGAAVVAKFNATSERFGFPERLVA